MRLLSIALLLTLGVGNSEVDLRRGEGEVRGNLRFEVATIPDEIADEFDGLNPQAYCEFLYIQRAGDDWDAITLDTTAFSGQTGLLRFTYDTLDACCSFEQGWFIDNIQTGMGC